MILFMRYEYSVFEMYRHRVKIILCLFTLFIFCGIGYVSIGIREYMTDKKDMIECKVPHNASEEAKQMICEGQRIGMQNRENARYDSEIDTSKLKGDGSPAN